MLVFLEINGYSLLIGDTPAIIDTIRTIENVASGEGSKTVLTEWIAARCRRNP